MGTSLISGIRNRNINKRTTACIIPAMGVRPPLLILVMVRAMAPVTGIPPKKGTTILAAPCAISSVLELVLSPVTPSATVAESKDSMAPNTAMVNAGESNWFIVSILIFRACGSGTSLLMLKRSPMVSIPSIPQRRSST